MKKFFVINTNDSITAMILQTIITENTELNVGLHLNNPLINSNKSLNIDDFIQNASATDKLDGLVTTYGNYRLYDDSLRQRTKHPFLRINIILNPEDRLKLIQQELLAAYKNHTVLELDSKLKSIIANESDSIIKSYLYHYFFRACEKEANKQGLDTSVTENYIFIFALAYVLSFDYTDIPVPGKQIQFESLIGAETDGIKKLKTTLLNKTRISDLEIKHSEVLSNLLENQKLITASKLGTKQEALFQTMIQMTLHSIYYPHLTKSLYQIYQDHGYFKLTKKTDNPNFKLISIQLNSNRPGQLISYFDNIEETADNPSLIEVIVNIDDSDEYMLKLISQQIKQRKFTIKYTTSPKPSSFCDLWKPINTIYKLTDPNAYFLLNISDEMIFADRGWDTRLMKYVDFYPDGFFRLRASRNKVRAYFDRWECSFAQDSIPITTKKWVDVGSNWNPCFGPDSFQQLVSFYLSKEGAYSNDHFLRDIPVFDIKFLGDIPSLGMEPSKHWKHIKDHIDAMFIFHSRDMLQEAKRRAIHIKANILIHGRQNYASVVEEDPRKKKVKIIDAIDNRIQHEFSYKVGLIGTTFTNNIRKLNYFSYFGDGNPQWSIKTIYMFLKYLRSRHEFFYKASKVISKRLHRIKPLIKDMLLQISKLKMLIVSPFRKRVKSHDGYLFLINPMSWLRASKKIASFLLMRKNRVSKLVILQKEVQCLKSYCEELKSEREILLNKLYMYEKAKMTG